MKDFFAHKYFEVVSWFLRTLGPQSIKDLHNAVETVLDSGNTDDIAIYPYGQYAFDIALDDGQHKSLAFPTPQERNAFQFGMSNAIRMMGGTINHLNQEQNAEVEKMMKLATHNSGGSRNN